jgi:hypothetical protein
MKKGKRKKNLVKDNITRDINSSSGYIETFDFLVHRTISQEHTPLGTENKLSFVVRTKISPTSTPKNPRGVIWGSVKEMMNRCVIIDNFPRKNIDEICSGKESFIPKNLRHRCMRQDS